jgi:hypothetical protein
LCPFYAAFLGFSFLSLLDVLRVERSIFTSELECLPCGSAPLSHRCFLTGLELTGNGRGERKSAVIELPYEILMNMQ